MQNITRFILTFFIAIPLVFGFGSQTVKQIDEIKNNTGTDILLNPTDKVDINYFTGEKALQSTVDGELEESAVTNTELGYMSGVTSSVQTQIDSKTPLTRLINTTTPLQGGGDLTTDRTLSILQSGAAQDGYLSSTDWNTFNGKQDAITGTNGDLYYWNSGLSNLAIGTNGQILQVSALGFPEWADLPPSVSVTTKGDLQTYSTAPDRLPVGTDGQVLQANSATSTGLEWIDPNFYTSPLTTQGDILYRDATQDTRLGIGTEGQLLTVTSGEPAWQDAPVTLPTQTGNQGLYLTTDGSNASWNEINEDTNEIKNNFLECSGFDGCTQEGTITNGAGVDASSIVSRTTETTAFNPSKLNLSQSLAGTLDYTYTKTASFDGKQLVAYCEIKTANSGVTFSAGADSVQAGSLSVSNTDTWKYYKIPLVGGATDQYFKIDHSDAATIPDIDVDNCFIGKSTEAIELGTAQFVGSLTWRSASCIWSGTSTIFASFAANPSCSVSNTKGDLLESDTKIPAIKIPNARVDGYYTIEAQGLLYANSASQCYFRLNTSDGGGVSSVSTTNNGEQNNSIRETFKFTSAGDKQVEIQYAKNTATDCRVYADSAFGVRSLTFNVHFFPDDTSTVVTQDTELTAKTANVFSFQMDNTGNVFQDSFDFINGNCTQVNQGTYYQYDCPLNDLNITQPLTCSVVSSQGQGLYLVSYKISTSSPSQISFTSQFSNGNSILASQMTAVCHKTDIDLNKSATIIGKFEQVEEVNKTLTAAEVNEFSAYVDSSGNVSQENYDWIDGNCSLGGSTFTCSYVAGLVNNDMNCLAVPEQSTSDLNALIFSSSASNVVVRTSIASTAADSARAFNLHCSKSGTDVNKNLSGVIINASKAKQEIADIVREDIVSSDLVKVEAADNAGGSLTGGVTPIDFIEITDNTNSWDGSTFTAPKTSYYHLSGATRITTDVTYFVYFYVDTGSGYNRIKLINDGAIINRSKIFNGAIKLNSGDKLQLRTTAGSTTLQSAEPIFHHLTITELPDTESIIKNLSNQKVECQTIFLTSNVTSNGAIGDLSPSTLEIGKKYKISSGQVYMNALSSLDSVNMQISHDGNSIVTTWVTSPTTASIFSSSINSSCFTATATSLSTTANSITAPSQISGDGTKALTHYELCKLPDNYICN